jgi:hypothetical protein
MYRWQHLVSVAEVVFAELAGCVAVRFEQLYVRLAGPMLKLSIFCTRTLIKLAMGFCAAFLSASLFVADAGVCSVAAWVPVTSTGACSCATRATVNNKLKVIAKPPPLTRAGLGQGIKLVRDFMFRVHSQEGRAAL